MFLGISIDRDFSGVVCLITIAFVISAKRLEGFSCNLIIRTIVVVSLMPVWKFKINHFRIKKQKLF